MTSGSAGSKAKARPGNISEMRLIQSSCIALRGDPQPQHPSCDHHLDFAEVR